LRSTIFKWSFFMKKNVLALSITAAVVGFGFAGGAQAMTGALGGTTSAALALNGDGVGHSLFVPYFSAQDTNNTLITLINTDAVNGKAVKVRFRGAANSDDIFDFQVFLSPSDVWTASVSKGANGLAKLVTTDVSCTKPARSVLSGASFLTARLDPSLTGDALNSGTREGYVEIFNMGDIPKLAASITGAVVDDTAATDAGYDTTAGSVLGTTQNPLYTAIKHVAKVAPCEAATGRALAAYNYLDNNDLIWNAGAAAVTNPRAAGLLPPTTGLMANWTIINVVGAAAWTGEAVAVQAVTAAVPPVVAKGNVVYWPQVATAAANPDNYTADPVFRTDAQKATGVAAGAVAAADATVVITTPGIAAGKYDLPDMSTPYYTAGALPANPLAQANALTASISATSVTNEFIGDPAITATTDWVFSQPTRRYSVALNYAAISTVVGATDDGRRFSELVDDGVALSVANGYFIPKNTVVGVLTGRQVCVKGLTFTYYDREESNSVVTATPVISPGTVAAAASLCGEASVLSINNGGSSTSGSLKATVTVRDVTTGYVDGWMKIGTPGGTTTGLPMVGAAFEKAVGGTSTFGATYNHRLTR